MINIPQSTGRLVGVLSLAAGTLLTGCAGGYDGWNSPSTGSMSPQSAARMSRWQDLERRVMAALSADPRVGAHGLKAEVQSEGVVTISGTPANGTGGRDLALQIARSVPGVRQVVNNMLMN